MRYPAMILLALPSALYAQNAMQVGFEGLVRQTPASVSAILGDLSKSQNPAGDGIKALMATGNFSHVAVRTEGQKLIFMLVERPIIANINLNGNKLIPKEALLEGLKGMGITQGRAYNESLMHSVVADLRNQYVAQGYFGATVNANTKVLDGGRVELEINFDEGKQARNAQVQIVGNRHFDDKDLAQEIELKTRVINPFSKKNRYSDEKLDQSALQILKKYQNAGFARADITHATAQIDDDNRAYVEIGINEGRDYRFGTVTFEGNAKDSNALHNLVAIKVGEKFSIDKINQTSQAIANYLGNDGYYFAKVQARQQIDDTTGVVNVIYDIDTGSPVYVRRIHFSGNIKTADEALRREMRQLEGALASNQKIALSQARLLRTGFFKDVQITPKAVNGHDDQMDLLVTVEEQPSGSASATAGYSQSGGVTFQLDLSQSNFLGTGNKVSINFARSQARESYNFGFTDPYFTKDGVSQSVNAYYRKTRESSKNINNYVMDSVGGALTYGYPIDENSRLSAGLVADKTTVHGGAYMAVANVDELLKDGGKVDTKGGISFEHGYKSASAVLGYSYSSLDRPLFSTKGMEHGVDLTVGVGKQSYQKIQYRGNAYFPLPQNFIARAYGRVGYGRNLPFYENFYAGGYGTVRGYSPQSLGPLSQPLANVLAGTRLVRGSEIGGNAMASIGAELIMPVPFKGDWATQMRPALFIEGAQVWDTTNKDKQTFLPKRIAPNNNAPAAVLLEQDKKPRFSAGVGVIWNTPIGPIAISYAMPLNKQPKDDIEKVQFQIGNVF